MGDQNVGYGKPINVINDFDADRLFLSFLISPSVSLEEVLACFDRPDLCDYFFINDVVVIFRAGTEAAVKKAIEILEQDVKDMGFESIPDYYRMLSKQNIQLH